MYSKYNAQEHGTQDTQAVQVGEDFKPNAERNAEIERLLNHNAEVFTAAAYREAKEPGGEWTPSPDYCGDDSVSLDVLWERGVRPMILPTVDAPSKKPHPKAKPYVQEYIAVFEIDGTLHVTVPFEKEEHAAACVLWYFLSLK